MKQRESDPSGKSANEAGAKLDAGKIRPSLTLDGMARALMAVAEVATVGAAKYSPNGWITVPNGIERYNDAMQRHMLAEATGEKYDTGPGGTGLRHAAQVAWNALAKLDLAIREEECITKTNQSS